MSITRVLESSGPEIVFERTRRQVVRKEQVQRLLDEKFVWASVFVEMHQAGSGVTKQELLVVESTLKIIDEELSLLGIINS